MKTCKPLLVLLSTCSLFLTMNSFVGQAGVEHQWSPDAHVPGYLDDTFPPFLLADQNKTVHAFASQWVENISRRRAVVYRQWTLEGGWTRPVDIILAPSGDAEILGACLDSDRIHIIFVISQGDISAVYYSSAYAEAADLATAWAPPTLVGNFLGLNSAAITGIGAGKLVIIYSGYKDGNGIYYASSSDAGKSWTEPSPLYLTYDSNLVPYSLRLAAGFDQQIRATWNVVTAEGVDEMLYSANYDVSNSTWSTPVKLDSRIDLRDSFGPSFPAIVDNGREVVIMYNGGSSFVDRPIGRGRPVQQVVVSRDGGRTWDGPWAPFQYHVGRSGEHALVLDGSGIPHGLFVQRIEQPTEDGQYSAIGGIWHSVFVNGNWTNPRRFVTTYTPHDIRAVVSQGNVLLAVWRQDPGEGDHGVWFSYNLLDVPESPLIPLSTVPPTVASPQVATAFPSLDLPTAFPNDILEGSSPAPWRSSPAFALVAGVIPVAFVVIGTLVAYHFWSDRRK